MSTLSVNIKMFQVGELGDCFLLKFKNDEKQSNVLIDCGSFRNSDESKTRLRTIVSFIEGDLKDDEDKTTPLDVVVGTHQHNDHYSGFVHAFDIFKQIGIDNVWLSWLDDPKDEKAGKIAAGQRKVAENLQNITSELKKSGKDNHSLAAERINDILGFYPVAAPLQPAEKKKPKVPVIPKTGIDNLKSLVTTPTYLRPGNVIDLPGMPGLVKVYVLGPPTDGNLLFDINPNKDETYDTKLTALSNLAEGYLSALKNFTGSELIESDERNFPFDKKYAKEFGEEGFQKNAYNLEDNAWRKIDDEWLDQAERLSLYLDTYTNNSSLVLAFELVQLGKVLLFVGDAQTGNWLSWKDIKWDEKIVKSGFSLDYLLNNTVLYKVGHHCSHNATLKEYLDDKITHPDLVAMIPVDRTDPNITKKNGWKMPAVNLYKKLKEKTQNRVLVMDRGYDDDCSPDGEAKESWAKVPFKPVYNEEKFYIEYEVHGNTIV